MWLCAEGKVSTTSGMAEGAIAVVGKPYVLEQAVEMTMADGCGRLELGVCCVKSQEVRCTITFNKMGICTCPRLTSSFTRTTQYSYSQLRELKTLLSWA